MKCKKLFGRNTNNRRQPRANHFVLESLEPRLLLSATPMTAAVVTTDHLDYAPGETAVITTSNQTGDGLQFSAGELVQFHVSRTDGMADAAGSTAGVGPAGNEAWYVTDGVGGFAAHLGPDVSGDGVADWIAPDNDLTVNSSISTTWFVEEQYRNSSLLVTASGQESGAMATQAFTDVAVNTTTVVTASSATSTYGDVVTFTATVTAAAGTDAPTGIVQFWEIADGTSLIGTATVADSTGAGTSTWSVNSFKYLIEGPHPFIHAVFIGTPGSFNDSTSASITHTVTAKQVTASFTVADKVYDGTTDATGVVVTLNGVLAPDDVRVAFSSVTFSDANVGGNKTVTLTGATLIGTERLNYSLASTTLTSSANITAKGITGNFTAANKVYDSTTTASVLTRTLTGVIGADALSLTGGTGTFADKNVGTGKTVTLVGATLTGSAAGNYSLLSVGTTTADIVAMEVTGSFAADNKVYDGTTDAVVLFTELTGFLAGDDVSLDGVATFATADAGLNKTVTLTGATLTGIDAGNYLLASVSSTTADIDKATVTLTVTGYFVTYDGNAHTATATAIGVTGEDLSAGVNLSGTTHTNAGTYTDAVTYTDTTGNYNNATKFVKDFITKATPTLTPISYLVTYDGNAHEATGTAIGVKGETLTGVTGTLRTNAGTYTDAVTYTDTTGNYKNVTKFVKDFIAKATPTLTATGYVVTYDGNAHQTVGTAIGVKGETLTGVTGSVRTKAGTYNDLVFYTDQTGNYKNVGKFVTDFIAKATPTLTVTGYSVTYDGTVHQATGTAIGLNGEVLSGLNLSSTRHTNAGTYSDLVTFTDVTGNYKNATKAVTNVIGKATVTLTVTGYAVPYDGLVHTASATATGVNGEDLSAGVNLSGTTHTDRGTYIDSVTFTDLTGNYKTATKLIKNFII